MNKIEAYQKMLQGFKVRNEYYSPEEFAFINDDGKIQTEDGCIMGGPKDEFWAKYQDLENKLEWSVVDEEPRIPDLIGGDPYIIHEKVREYSGYFPRLTKKQSMEVIISVKPSKPMDRNSPCKCGSGVKTKKCKCNNI